MSDITMSKDASADRFVVFDDGIEAGFMSYFTDEHSIIIDHTVVDEAYQGQGLASKLVQFGLDYLGDESDLPIVAQCPYVASWLERHPDYQALTTR